MSTASASVNQNLRPTQLLGTIHVSGGNAVIGDLFEFLKTQLEAAADANMPQDVRDKVRADLADGMKFTSFVPHPDISDDEVKGTQTLTFNIDTSHSNELFFEVNGQPYDPNRIDRTLMLGGVDEWTITSNFVSHPFHIHVNPSKSSRLLRRTAREQRPRVWSH